jgi:hypothetical protein
VLALPEDPNGESTAGGDDAQATPGAATENGSAPSAPEEPHHDEEGQPTGQSLPSALPSGLPRVEPVTSGRSWERVDPQPVILQRTNNLCLVRDRAEPDVVAYFKWPKAGSLHSSAYSIGVERVGYELASLLSLPVPATYLEEFEGNDGVVSIQVPGAQAWGAVSENLLRGATFTNRDRWAILLGLDVLLGHPDRNPDNILLQIEREESGRGEARYACTTSFIDYGHSALWPPWKFEPNRTAADLLKTGADEPLTTVCKAEFRGVLPRQVRAAFPLRNTDDRAPIVETLRQITHDAIQVAVGNVSDAYFTADAADLTVRWIDGRLGRLATLVDEVFPM